MKHLYCADAQIEIKDNTERLITTRLRSFLLATFPPIFQLLISISNTLKSCHKLLDVIKAFVEHLLTHRYRYTHNRYWLFIAHKLALLYYCLPGISTK